jgi:hypothetical protein
MLGILYVGKHTARTILGSVRAEAHVETPCRWILVLRGQPWVLRYVVADVGCYGLADKYLDRW